MVMRVERRGEEYVIPVPRETVEELHLFSVGTEVRVLPVETNAIHYITVEEALAAYRRTEFQHRNAYEKLAKRLDVWTSQH
jgi:hypothetical protein